MMAFSFLELTKKKYRLTQLCNRGHFINKSHNSSKINKARMVLHHLSKTVYLVGAKTDRKSVEALRGKKDGPFGLMCEAPHTYLTQGSWHRGHF